MKREIKFRAWDGKEYDFLPTIWNGGVWDPRMDEPIEGAILEQFTGLYDTDGAEIYEGDIIQVLDNKGVVGWSTKFSSFTISGDTWNFKNFFGTDPIDYKVIGNIHENSL